MTIDYEDLNAVKNLPERLVRADHQSLTEENWMNLKQHRKAEQELDETVLLLEYLKATGADLTDSKNFSVKTVKKAKQWKIDGLTNGILGECPPS